jgi:hypothetical protein
MKDAKPLGDLSVVDFPRETMGLVVAAVPPASSDSPVSLAVEIPYPQPTAVTDDDLFPETFFGCTLLGHIEPPCSVAVPPEFTLAGVYSSQFTRGLRHPALL